VFGWCEEEGECVNRMMIIWSRMFVEMYLSMYHCMGDLVASVVDIVNNE
jgi:hypothetical protein